jgi:hypothetical protein
MSKYYYDLHTHSALSPCADNDATPSTIAGIGKLSGLDIIALTDHNTAKNCPAFFRAAEEYGVIAVAGMEMTTSEDIHLVCLFKTLDDAMSFDAEIDKYRTKIKNRPEIFGEQLILDEDDEILGKEENLLPVALAISVEDAPRLVEKYGGVCYPAHIDREANGIIAVLGTFPNTPPFTAFEIRDKEKAREYTEKYSLSGLKLIISSDAHNLESLGEAENCIELDVSRDDKDGVRCALIDYLRKREA